MKMVELLQQFLAMKTGSGCFLDMHGAIDLKIFVCDQSLNLNTFMQKSWLTITVSPFGGGNYVFLPACMH